MENVKRLAGLILLTCISIALEMYIPRIDTLIVIVLLLLENREYKTLVCMLPLILLIQEGMGTQHFGASILFLAAVFALYRLLSCFHLFLHLGPVARAGRHAPQPELALLHAAGLPL